MKIFNLAYLGFGNVARALVQLVETKRTELRERCGIPNSTTNQMLTEMENSASFDQAVKNAQDQRHSVPRHQPRPTQASTSCHVSASS